VSYFLALVIWASEFNQRLSEAAPISDLVRPPGPDLGWTLAGDQSLGYSYW
jgi:hypothetical protein